MIKEDILKDINYWARRAYSARMTPATSGNISRFEEDIIFMSRSGVCLGDMGNEDVSELNINGDLLNGIKPSSEKLMHLEIYKKRPDIKAVIHIHCPYTTSFAVCHKEMNEPILPEFIYNFGTVPSAKYALPSSMELAQEVSGYFSNGHNAVLMQNHGLVAGGKTLKEVFYHLESIQAYAKTYFAAKFLGKIHKLNKDEIKKINDLKG